MKKNIFISLFICFILFLELNAAIGDWRVYNSYYHASDCQVVGDKVYVLAAGKLYAYGKDDNELRVFDHINTLSDVKISFIDYSDVIDALVVVYDNANIDLFYDDESVYNISDFKNKTLENKQINNLQVADSMAYISTDFGIVLLNLKKQEFSNTYTLNLNVNSTMVHDGYLYACTTTGLYRGRITDNLLDNKNWTKLFDYPVSAIDCYKGKLFCILPQLGFYGMDFDGRLTLLIRNENNRSFSYIKVGENKMLVGSPFKVYVYDSAETYAVYDLNGKSCTICEDGNDFWSCNGDGGLLLLSVKNGSLVGKGGNIQPNSPVRSYCEYLNFSSTGKLLVAGGNLNYFDETFYDGTVMAFDGTEWLNFQEQEIKDATGLNYQNITSVAEDPFEDGHYFASSFGYGLYEFRNGEFVKHYNHKNSVL